jgi:hypothetical protein
MADRYQGLDEVTVAFIWFVSGDKPIMIVITNRWQQFGCFKSEQFEAIILPPF